jgi:hypothetical protein
MCTRIRCRVTAPSSPHHGTRPGASSGSRCHSRHARDSEQRYEPLSSGPLSCAVRLLAAVCVPRHERADGSIWAAVTAMNVATARNADFVRLTTASLAPVEVRITSGSGRWQLANSTVLDRCTDSKRAPDTDEMTAVTSRS